MPPTTRKSNTQAAVTPAEPPTMPPPAEDAYAPTAWTGASQVGAPEDLIVPSGQRCLVRRPGLEQLLREGVLFESDTLTTIVHENIERVEKGLPQKDVDINAFMNDPKKFEELMNTTDRIVCAVVLKPALQRAPNDPTNRKPGVVYTDMVALEDKFTILEFAMGGSTALADFRGGSSENVGSVRTGKSSSSKAKRTSRRN